MCDIDKAFTIDIYNQLIIFLENAGCRMLSSNCDQGGANDGPKENCELLKASFGIKIPSTLITLQKSFFLPDFMQCACIQGSSLIYLINI